jgi:uncharacterized protein YsxB (DUF464 family)
MTSITVYKANDLYIGFKVSGHSGCEESGKDIVCAGISALTINFINSVEEFMDDRFVCSSNEADGMIEFKFEEQPSKESQVLLDSLVFGFENLANDYKEFISLEFREV